MQWDWIKSTICEDHSSPVPDFCITGGTEPTDPPVLSECEDLLWFDNYGDDCSWYSSTYLCEKYGDLWPNDQGLTADDACCLCGGGNRPTLAPSMSPSASKPINDSCQDLDFVDAWGDGCARYEETNACKSYGNEYANDQGLTANMACCICGGGTNVTTGEDGEDPLPPSTHPSPPTTVTTCKDSPLKFMVNIHNRKTCRWVGNKPWKRCKKEGVASHCPETCGQCETYQCKDSQVRWYPPNNTEKNRKCGWVDRKRVKRCRASGVSETCRETCGVCN